MTPPFDPIKTVVEHILSYITMNWPWRPLTKPDATIHALNIILWVIPQPRGAL